MSFLKKVQKLPLGARKIILFAIIAIIGIILIWLWAKNFSFGDFQGEKLKEGFKIPSLREKLEKDLPKLEAPGLEIPSGFPDIPGLETQ